MPLLDHFHAPFKDVRHWEGMHSTWATAIVAQLNGSVLPVEYFAEPHIKLGVPVEIDVATWEQERHGAAEQNGGVATAVYAPPEPALRFAVDFSEIDTFEVRIRQEQDLQLVAALEIVSPANKDRPTHRQAFVTKCASYLQQGVSVIIVDVVTERSGNLHAGLLAELAPATAIELDADEALYAVAYRAQPIHQVEAWTERLEIGKTLPTLPLWVSDIMAFPVDFEKSYLAACKILRLRNS